MKQWLLSIVLLTLSLSAGAQATYQQRPTDDIWVYSNSSDPSFDPLLRIWGTGTSTGSGYPPGGDWSYGYLKWNVSTIPVLGAGQYYQVTEAVLTATSQRAIGYTLTDAIANPLEARPLGTNFSELTWLYDDANNPAPGDPRFGIGDMSAYSTTVVYTIPINLLTGPGDFQAHFNQAIGSGELGLALTSSMPAVQQGGKFYRIYSKDDPGNRGPSLRVAYRPVCDVTGVIELQEAQNGAQAVTLEFRPTDNAAPFQKNITLASDGSFTVGNIPLKSYEVGIKGAKWLRKVVAVDATLAPATEVSTTLNAGDANNDNSVDVFDLDPLIQAFNSIEGDANWNGGAADFNCDGSTDVFDLDLLIRNFNSSGDE
jgi:hypothetical protein